MTLALTKFKSYGRTVSASVRKWGIQEAELWITGASTDNVLDISNFSGTFWTAALADATYGALASSAETALKSIQTIVNGLSAVESEQLIVRIPNAALGSNGQYNIAVNSHLPDISVKANDGLSLWVLTFRWQMKDATLPVTTDLGADA